MKWLLCLPAALLLMAATWRTDFDKAKDDARTEHKLILLKFSGSDWCIPCIRMEKSIFSDDSFLHFAQAHLEMVNADFPRLGKHHLSKDLTKQNEALAERYNKDGHFPYTLLLSADGKVLKTWEGYTGAKPTAFMDEISRFTNAQ